MMAEPLGFNPENLLTMQIFLPEAHYSQPANLLNFYQTVVDRAAALPGVKSASAVNFLPLTGWTGFCDFDIAGRANPPSGEHFTAQYRAADWRYLRTMGDPRQRRPRFRILGRAGFARRRARSMKRSRTVTGPTKIPSASRFA